MKEHECIWYQHRMLEFVTDDPGLPQNEKDKIQYHLDQFCANCRRHHELEIELQAGRAK